MTPGTLNRICAHPVIISWILGACVSNGAVIWLFSNKVSLFSAAADWQSMLCLLIALITSSLLGYFVGMFTWWPLIRVVCSRLNGAPLKTGDQVMILSGPQKGNTAEVYEITIGQGGWDLARLNLGHEHKTRFKDIYEAYSLLKIKRGEPDGEAKGSQPMNS